jgi:L-alanine-DL-glutamate epimerase-like enolase superfamily enzyme
VEQAYRTTIEKMIFKADPTTYVRINEDLKFRLPSLPAARAMVDMLMYDLVAKYAGLPLYRLLGGYHVSIPTSVTIGIMGVRETLEKAIDLVRQKFFILKIKGGKNVEEDIERVLKIHEKFGDTIGIRFDANQGYTPEEAIKFVEATRMADIDILEQPTPREKRDLLGMVMKKSTIPVMADESLMNLSDAFHLASNDLSDMINIKLMKVGGITEALHINSVARAAGLECMVGCMDESALSISAGMHLALSRANIVYADLDGHLDLLNDPASGAVIIKNGIMYPSDEPGLGISELDL